MLLFFKIINNSDFSLANKWLHLYRFLKSYHIIFFSNYALSLFLTTAIKDFVKILLMFFSILFCLHLSCFFTFTKSYEFLNRNVKPEFYKNVLKWVLVINHILKNGQSVTRLIRTVVKNRTASKNILWTS